MNQTLESVAGKTCVLKFWADFCMPCKVIAPIIKELCEEEKIELVEIDVDVQDDFARAYSIRSLPTVVVLKDGVVIDSWVGSAKKEKYREMILKVK